MIRRVVSCEGNSHILCINHLSSFCWFQEGVCTWLHKCFILHRVCKYSKMQANPKTQSKNTIDCLKRCDKTHLRLERIDIVQPYLFVYFEKYTPYLDLKSFGSLTDDEIDFSGSSPIHHCHLGRLQKWVMVSLKQNTTLGGQVYFRLDTTTIRTTCRVRWLGQNVVGMKRHIEVYFRLWYSLFYKGTRWKIFLKFLCKLTFVVYFS